MSFRPLVWLCFLLAVCSASAAAADSAVFVSEFMAVNVFTIGDDEGDSSDWLELYNPSPDAPVDLSGWFLTDDGDNLTRWRVPDGVTLDPGEHRVVFASGKDRSEERTLHTNFKLSSGGEYLALVRPDGETVEHDYTPAFPSQFQDLSFGLPEDAAGDAAYLAEPTPGKANSGPISPGPVVTAIHCSPEAPSEDDDITVVAEIQALLAPIALVALTYRVMYDAESAPLAMHDDGIAPDVLAGDGLYAAEIPSTEFGPGDMVRWKIEAADTGGNVTRSPLFPEPLSSPEYHGTVVADPDAASPLPVFQWFLRPGTESAAGTRTGTRASVSFLGEFYDNVFVRVRGGSTASLAKKSYKFDFNPKHHFRFDERYGRVSEININTTYPDKSYVRQCLGFEVYDRSGAPGSESFNVRVQRNGGFFSVAAFIEQPDEDLLRREHLGDTGALYKMFNTFTSGTSGVEKKSRLYENNSDLSSFISNINSRSGDSLLRYVCDNVDIPRVLNYLACNALIQNNDCMAKNYYLYRDSDGTGEWLFLPWDLDLTFGRHFMTQDSILGDTIWAAEDWILGGSARNVPIYPSHPFMGTRELPGNRSWNRLIDALFSLPDFTEMYRRRLWTLMEDLYGSPDVTEGDRLLDLRLAELRELLADDAALDRAKWGQFGQGQTLEEALSILRNQYLSVRRNHLFVTHHKDNAPQYPEPHAFSAELSEPLEEKPFLAIGAFEVSPPSGNQDEEYIQVINPFDEAVDISGWRLEGAVEHTFLDGTVVPANSELYVTPSVRTFRLREESPAGGERLFVQGAYNGHLSNWGETLCLVASDGEEVDCVTYEGSPGEVQRFLRVTEVQYHPLDPTGSEIAAGFDNQNDFEFLELCNVSTDTTLDLTGVKITEGVAFDFSTALIKELAPGGVLLLVSNIDAFEKRYGTGLPVAGTYAPYRLDNGGETIKIEDPASSTVQEFAYDDDGALGWPAAADGAGPSLEVVDALGDYDSALNWEASAEVHGTPGRAFIGTGRAPGKATQPQPQAGANGTALFGVLSWKRADGAARYELYFGTTETPPLVAELFDTVYFAGQLAPETTYYWYVVSVNEYGATKSDLWSFTTGTGEGPPRFIRGDVNQSGVIDLSDAVFTLLYLFSDHDIDCADAADVTDDGAINIADPVALLSYLFAGGSIPPDPFNRCGEDPTDDALPLCRGNPVCRN